MVCVMNTTTEGTSEIIKVISMVTRLNHLMSIISPRIKENESDR